MNKFYMNGKLIHKASEHNTKRCGIEKWVFLPHSDFERLKANPYQQHEAITAAKDLMYEDKNAYHCIMLLDEYGEDGLLIEAEGFDYPPAIKENKTTTTVRTSPPVVTTKAPQATMPAKLITTAPPITTAEIYTEPAKMNITEHWLTYFSDSHNKDYYINVGRSLSNDGSECNKVQAVFDYVTANFSNDDSCTYLSAVTMCLCEGIGLDCKYALIFDWYAHCANAVNVDSVWYVLDTQAGGFLCGNFGFTSILDEYENEFSVTLSDNDYE